MLHLGDSGQGGELNFHRLLALFSLLSLPRPTVLFNSRPSLPEDEVKRDTLSLLLITSGIVANPENLFLFIRDLIISSD